MEKSELPGTHTDRLTCMAGRWTALSLTIALAVVWLAPIAAANNFGGTDGTCPSQCFNEGPHQRYWWSPSFGSDWQTAGNYNRTNNINPTDMSTEVVSSHDDSDVAAYMGNYGNTTWFARALCIDDAGAICHHWHAEFNKDKGPFSADMKKHLTCHEFGHTTGLDHYPNPSRSCMEDFEVPPIFSDHDVFHINDYF